LSDYESALQINPKLQEAIDGAKRVNQLLATSEQQQIAQVQQQASVSQSPPRIAGADLYIDVAQYIGRPVILTDGEVQGANNYGALIKAGATTFKIATDGIDRESYRFFLKNCSGFRGEQCRTPLLVTPTGEKSGQLPVVRDVKMIQ
jgi:hypothetical protein